MKKIPLTQGKVALVDDADFEWLNQWKWYAQINRVGTWYAMHAFPGRPRQQKISMHQLLFPTKLQVDHINGNGLDNQRKNFREATNGQNKANSRKEKGCSSRFKGVTWHKRDQRWQAMIQHNQKQMFLGYFTNEKHAALAYDTAAHLHFGEFARTNF